MEYTVRQLSRLAGVSPRTLRYYDEIGLLAPGRVTDAGYRIYGPAQVDALQQILFYRELGLPLEEIARILKDPGFDPGSALRGHLAELERRRERLSALILTVQKTISHQERSETMSDKEKFEGFKQSLLAENEANYGVEIRARYGEEAVQESNYKFAGLSQAEYEAMTGLAERIQEKLEAAVEQGLAPDSPQGRELTELHRQWLGCTWSRYAPQAHRELVQMYVDDPRFTAYYDSRVPGCAEFLCRAVQHFAQE